MPSDTPHHTITFDPTQLLAQAMFTAPNIYANGFAHSCNDIDITTICMWNNKPTAAFTLSIVVAKSLAVALTDLVRQVEQRSGSTFETIPEIMARLGVNGEQNK